MEQQERFRGSVPKGTMVEYFPRGRKTEETDTSGPVFGIVYRGSDGQLDLIVFNHRGEPSLKKAVFHVTHPDLYDHFGNISGAGDRIGSWDWLPGQASKCSCNVDEKVEGLGAATETAVTELAARLTDLENGLGGAVDSLLAKLKDLESQVAKLSKKADKTDKPTA